jgi:hypothetical protein
VLCKALVFDQSTEYYQTHPQQQRIASRRLYFCNVALQEGHTLIHMATSLPKLKTIHAVC